MPHGRAPTSTDPSTLLVAVSIVNTRCPRPVLTYNFAPSGDIRTAIGFTAPGLPSGIGLIILSRLASTSTTVPSFSALTYAFDPSGENAIERGLCPTLNVFVILPVAGSNTEIVPVSSEVTQTAFPSGVTFTPSGCAPTLADFTTVPEAMSTTLTAESSSFDV